MRNFGQFKCTRNRIAAELHRQRSEGLHERGRFVTEGRGKADERRLDY